MIKAETHTDDRAVEVDFDATPYFQSNSDEVLAELFECGFAGDEPADQVAIELAESNPEIGAMFRYLEARNRASRKSIGFEVNVNEEDALAWLRQNRPNVFKHLDPQQYDLGDYDLAQCHNCRNVGDRDDMEKRGEKDGPMVCSSCRPNDTTWLVTKNPRNGIVEIPDATFVLDTQPYPNQSHAIGFIDGPEDDSDWSATWMNCELEMNEDGTAVRPEGSNEPWAQLHDT